MGKKEIWGDCVPGAGAEKARRVVYPKPGEPLVGTIIGDSVVGVLSHWQAATETEPGRTIMCAAPGPCVCETTPLPSKWHGYIGFDAEKYRDPCVLTLTGSGVNALTTLAAAYATFRGLRLRVERTSMHPSSPMRLARLDPLPNRYLPKAFAITPTLIAIYGAEAVAHWERRQAGKGGAS